MTNKNYIEKIKHVKLQQKIIIVCYVLSKVKIKKNETLLN